MKKISFNRNQLKYMVIVAMLLDHIAWAFVPQATILGQVLHFVGRLCGPVMAYFLAEGYIYTRNKTKYAIRLGVFGLLSWMPFSLFERGSFPTLSFGVIYTLFLGFIAIWIWDKAPVILEMKLAAELVLCILSLYGDWSVFDVLWPLFLFLYWEDEKKKWEVYGIIAIAATVAGLFATPWWSGLFQLGIMAVVPLLKYGYNGEKGSSHPFHKWFFYVFYPLHLFCLYGIKVWVSASL